jgi:predicted alpha/beta-fold hydrolase
MNVVRVNMRNCGGSGALTPTVYHSGRFDDVGAVVNHFAQCFSLRRVAFIGDSMGGNLVLMLAGGWGVRRTVIRYLQAAAEGTLPAVAPFEQVASQLQ